MAKPTKEQQEYLNAKLIVIDYERRHPFPIKKREARDGKADRRN